MFKSESISALTKALVKAQTKMGAAVKDAKNPFFKSSYADLSSVIEVVKDPLNENNIAILQSIATKDGQTIVETILMHESGEFIGSETPVICAKQNDPQAQGAAISYSRRYGLQALLSIPTEDSDAEGAMDRKSPPKKEESPLQQKQMFRKI